MISLGRPSRRMALSGLAALVAAAIFSAPAGAAGTPGGADIVRSFYDVLLATMRDGPSLAKQGRYAKLEPVVLRSFDIPYMTRMAVGPAWSDLPEAKQEQVTQAFGRYITATWADRFDSYSGEKLDVTGERPYASATLVETRIVKPDGEPVAINYLMRPSAGTWRIADVYLTGTISELATRRSEFAAVLRSQGIDGLIAVLNRKSGNMVPAAARS